MLRCAACEPLAFLRGTFSMMILPTGVHPIPAAGDRKVNGSLARVTVTFANCLVISRSYLKELQHM